MFAQSGGPTLRSRNSLLTLTITFCAVMTQAIVARSRPTLVSGDVPSRRAGVVVVMDPLVYGLESFVD
jgi:hypothetical protein